MTMIARSATTHTPLCNTFHIYNLGQNRDIVRHVKRINKNYALKSELNMNNLLIKAKRLRV